MLTVSASTLRRLSVPTTTPGVIWTAMVFAFSVSHGAHHAIASFSYAHQIGAAAWPVALVLMALLEVSTRIAIVQLRGRHAMTATGGMLAAAA